ncbi:MAG: hypothetical protein SH857_05525 [Chitinophagales bacterium]|nr:hypothetical protein [Chitinophagales bacterium]
MQKIELVRQNEKLFLARNYLVSLLALVSGADGRRVGVFFAKRHCDCSEAISNFHLTISSACYIAPTAIILSQ